MLRITGVFVLIVLTGGPSHAQDAPCTEAQATRALNEADSLRTWDGLFKSYRRFHQCDDGDVADGYSESVARILVDHWKTLPRLAQLAKRRDDFWQFVLDHVDSSYDPDDLRKIKRRAATQCPAGLRTICSQLRKAAASAIEDLATDESHAQLRWQERRGIPCSRGSGLKLANCPSKSSISLAFFESWRLPPPNPCDA